MITYLLYTEILTGPIFTVSNYQEVVASYRRFLEVLTVKPQIIASSNVAYLENIKGNIEFKNVNFNYAKPAKSIFQNLNLKIHASEYIALVSSSGVRKSILCNLIPRFYGVYSSEILVNGVNVKNIKLKSLR